VVASFMSGRIMRQSEAARSAEAVPFARLPLLACARSNVRMHARKIVRSCLVCIPIETYRLLTFRLIDRLPVLDPLSITPVLDPLSAATCLDRSLACAWRC